LFIFSSAALGRSRRAPKPTWKVYAAAGAVTGDDDVDVEQDVSSFDAISPRRAPSDSKRNVPPSPGVDASPSRETVPKKALQAKPRPKKRAPTDGEPSKPVKEAVVVPQALEELVNRARDAPGVCLCVVAMVHKGPHLAALARRLEDDRRAAGEKRSKYAVKKAESIAYLCPVHLDDVDAVKKLVEKESGPRNTVEQLTLVVSALTEDWHDVHAPGDVNGGMSVVIAYTWYLLRVLRPSLFVVGTPADAMFVALVPHLLRDLTVNHNWHIVNGYSRVGARGTRQRANGLDNLGEFCAIMLFCVAHYTGDHQECGLSRTPYVVCMESINILPQPSVTQASISAASKVCAFVSQHRVTDVGVTYPNQAVLIAHFAAL
jgi:hypothetical protein